MEEIIIVPDITIDADLTFSGMSIDAGVTGVSNPKEIEQAVKEGLERIESVGDEYVSEMTDIRSGIEEGVDSLSAKVERKQDIISDLDTIRNNADKGASAIQEETDPTVPSWAKQPTKPTYTAREVGALPDTTVIPDVPIDEIEANTRARHTHYNMDVLNSIEPSRFDAWDKKQDPIEDLDTIRSGASKGATAVQEEIDPTVPSWAKTPNKPVYTADEVGALSKSVTHLSGDIPTTEKGSAYGVATLGSDGKVPSSQLPSYVDDVLEYSTKDDFPRVGESGKIYVDANTNITYRWSGYIYIAIGSDLALGETSSTAYAGDKGKRVADTLDAHISNGVIHTTQQDKDNINANTEARHTHTNKSVLDGITAEKITQWDNNKGFSGDYNDLINKPTIPTVPTDEIHANTEARHTHSNKSVLDTIDTAKINSWNNKSDFSGSYNDLSNKPTIPTVPTDEINANTQARHTHGNKTVLDGITSDKVTAWDNKSDFDGNYDSLSNKPSIPSKTSELTNDSDFVTESDVPEQLYFPITEDIVTVTTDDTKGVAPYSTSYGYTNIEINKDAGIRWVEGGLYSFIVNTKMVVASANRNVRIRIGGDTDGDVWHPFFGTSAILAGNSYLVKAYNTTFQYKSVYREEGALHLQTDNNTTYAYLTNTIVGDATASPTVIDPNGYGARYSLIFPTTPLGEAEKWSSLVASSSTGTTKKILPNIDKYYIDRHPQYIYSANVVAGAMPVNSLYQDYSAMDLRYTVNTSATYLTRSKKVFLWLKDYSEDDMTFKADATIGNIMTIDKVSTRFPYNYESEVYLYFLGWTTATWYSLSPNFTQAERIYKYTPSTQEFELVRAKGGGGSSYEEWIGTQADWDNDTGNIPKADIAEGGIINITDDYTGGGGSSVDILNTMEEINANTSETAVAGAKLVKELSGGLRFGIDADGNYGYYKVGADTLTPFKSGGGLDFIYNIHNYSNALYFYAFWDFTKTGNNKSGNMSYNGGSFSNNVLSLTLASHTLTITAKTNLSVMYSGNKYDVSSGNTFTIKTAWQLVPIVVINQ